MCRRRGGNRSSLKRISRGGFHTFYALLVCQLTYYLEKDSRHIRSILVCLLTYYLEKDSRQGFKTHQEYFGLPVNLLSREGFKTRIQDTSGVFWFAC